MVINYIILAHKAPDQLLRLVEKLCGPDVFIYIHIDANVHISPFESALKNIGNVVFLQKEKRVASVWGSIGIVTATLNAISEIVKDKRRGYTILMSGQCYPVKNNAFIYTYLKNNYGYNFIEGFELPDPRWHDAEKRIHQYSFFMSSERGDCITVPPLFDIPLKQLLKKNTIKNYVRVFFRHPLKITLLLKKRRFPKKMKPYGGLQWWALPYETLKFINNFVTEHPEYLKYHLYTLMPDEIFFQTIVHNFFKKVKHPITFAYWASPYNANPETLTTEHFTLLKERKELFARKFDYNIDKKVLDIIDDALLKNN